MLLLVAAPRSPAAVAPRASSRRPDGAKCACLLRTGSASKRHCASVEMEAWGLSIASLNPQILLESTIGIARGIAANGPVAVRQAKQAIYRGMQMSLWGHSAFEIDAYNRLVSTEDRREGVLAFNEGRKGALSCDALGLFEARDSRQPGRFQWFAHANTCELFSDNRKAS